MKRLTLGAAVAAALLAGCASRQPMEQPVVAPVAQRPVNLAAANMPDVSGDVPPNAKPGECYARVVLPAQFRDEPQTLLLKAASESVEVVPAQFKEIEKSVLVRPASMRYETVPAEFETVRERVLVKPASTRLEEVAPTYQTVTERVLVKPAQQVWQRGSSADAIDGMTKIDDATGDLLCLVEVPAEYATVSKQVVATPAGTREVEVPAEYATIETLVMKTPATTTEVRMPAEFKQVRATELVAPALEVRKPIAAEYQTVTKRLQISAARQEWRPVLCQNNATVELVAGIQAALAQAGFEPGRADGVMTEQTFKAIQSYQTARSLPVDTNRTVNLETVRALGALGN